MSPQGNFPQHFPQYIYVHARGPMTVTFVRPKNHRRTDISAHAAAESRAVKDRKSNSVTGPSPGGPYNPHAAAPMGQPYTPMSGNPAGYGRGDPSAGWAPQPGAYPPNQYGAYHG
jgi:hypothetical protein